MSHHASGPNFGFPRGDARLDMTDLYAFTKPGDPDKSILILNVHPSFRLDSPEPTTSEHASCEDFRASADIGLEVDEADDRAGNKIVAPVHVLWGAKNTVGQEWDVLATWRAKATSTVTGHSLDCGHFLQEERPEETLEELQNFFGAA